MPGSSSDLGSKSISVNKFVSAIGFLILLHVLISMTFIVFPHFLKSTVLSNLYKSYLTPGPFFSEDRITKTNYLFIEWLDDKGWSAPTNPAVINYDRGLSTASPIFLYRSRLDRAVYQKWMTSALLLKDDSMLSKTFQREVLPYYRSRYVKGHVDSIRLTVIQQQVLNFKVEQDTLYTFQF